MRSAALVEPLAVALHAIHNGHPALGDTIAVIGVGAVGLFVVETARLAGAAPVAAIDVVPGRLDLATKLGAAVTLKPEDASEAGLAAVLGEAPAVVFDCAGTPSTLQFACSIVRRHGTIVLVGHSTSPVPIITKEWSRKELTLITSMAYTDEFPLGLRLIAEGKIDVDSVASHVVKLEQVGDALKGMKTNPSSYIKVLVQP